MAINNKGQILVAANVTGSGSVPFPSWLATVGSIPFVSDLNSEAFLLVPQGDAPVVESVKVRGTLQSNVPIPFMVVIDESAPPAGLTVNLSAGPSVSLPSQVFIPGGSNKVLFNATSSGAGGPDTIVGQLNNAWQTVTFDVNSSS